MKTLLLCLLLSLLSNVTFSQEVPKGFGIFKIGELTVEGVQEFAKKVGVKIKKQKGVQLTMPRIAELPSIDNLKFYLFQKTEEAGLTFSSIYLTFYNDTLYDMLAYPIDKKPFTAYVSKYGPAVKISSDTTTKKCAAGLSVIELIGITNSYVWENESINFTYLLGNNVSSDCASSFSEVMHFTDKQKSALVQNKAHEKSIKVNLEGVKIDDL